MKVVGAKVDDDIFERLQSASRKAKINTSEFVRLCIERGISERVAEKPQRFECPACALLGWERVWDGQPQSYNDHALNYHVGAVGGWVSSEVDRGKALRGIGFIKNLEEI